MQGKLIKVEEVAQTLGISRSFAYQLMRTGQIRTVHIGQSRRVKRRDLEGFISENTYGGSGILNCVQGSEAHGSEVINDKSFTNDAKKE